MGFGDKLKDLRKQAQDAVAENSEKIHTALDAAAVAANEKTGGKHAQRIVKFGEKASGAVDKFGAGAGEEDPASESGESAQPSAEAAPGPEPTVPAGEPEAPTAPPTAGPPPPPPPSPAPAANPDLAAWAAGDDSAGNQ
jgi:MT0933-like antitoxin protein